MPSRGRRRTKGASCWTTASALTSQEAEVGWLLPSAPTRPPGSGCCRGGSAWFDGGCCCASDEAVAAAKCRPRVHCHFRCAYGGRDVLRGVSTSGTRWTCPSASCASSARPSRCQRSVRNPSGRWATRPSSSSPSTTTRRCSRFCGPSNFSTPERSEVKNFQRGMYTTAIILCL